MGESGHQKNGIWVIFKISRTTQHAAGKDPISAICIYGNFGNLL